MISKTEITRAIIVNDTAALVTLLQSGEKGSKDRVDTHDFALQMAVIRAEEGKEGTLQSLSTVLANHDAPIEAASKIMTSIPVINNYSDRTVKALEKSLPQIIALAFEYFPADQRVEAFNHALLLSSKKRSTLLQEALLDYSSKQTPPLLVADDMDRMMIKIIVQSGSIHHESLLKAYETQCGKKELSKELSDFMQLFTFDNVSNIRGTSQRLMLLTSSNDGQEYRYIPVIAEHGNVELLDLFLKAYPNAFNALVENKDRYKNAVIGCGSNEMVLKLIDAAKNDDDKLAARGWAVTQALIWSFPPKTETVTAVLADCEDKGKALLSANDHEIYRNAVAKRFIYDNRQAEQYLLERYEAVGLIAPTDKINAIGNAVWFQMRTWYQAPLFYLVLGIAAGVGVGVGLGLSDVDMWALIKESPDNSQHGSDFAIAAMSLLTMVIIAGLGYMYTSNACSRFLTLRSTPPDDTVDKPAQGVETR